MTTSNSKKPPQRRDAEKTRQALMKAGLREFAQYGFSGARAERIALASRRNIRMLYHYFGSKKGLYEAVLEEAYADIRTKEAELDLDIDEPLESLLTLMRFTFGYFESTPLFEGLLRTENMARGRFVRTLRRVPENASTLIQRIQHLIAKGQDRGQLRAGLDAQQVYVTITALSRFHLANVYTMSALLGCDLSDPDWRARRLEHCLAMLRAYLTNPERRGRGAPQGPAFVHEEAVS